MAWETIKKRFGGANKPRQWRSTPAISITKKGFAINGKATEVFDLKSDWVHVLVDREGRRIGLKSVTNGDAIEDGAFRVRRAGGSKKSSTRYCTCTEIAKSFADAIGLSYRLHLNAGERVIEAQISSDNMIR